MQKLTEGLSKEAGQPPGTLVHAEQPRTGPVTITLMEYNAENVTERPLVDVSEAAGLANGPGVAWIDIDGIHDHALLKQVGEVFPLHPLLLEDIGNTRERPKAAEYDSMLHITLGLPHWNDSTSEVNIEQVSLVVCPHMVLSFQERPDEDFDAVRNRIRAGHTRIRRLGAGYLAYALVDTIVDHYFVVLERLGGAIDVLEDRLLETTASPDALASIHALRRDTSVLRRAAWPLRGLLNKLEHGESPLVGDETAPHLRDVEDHAIQIVETLEVFQDTLTSLTELYLLRQGQRTNETMKVLAVIGAVFIPLTFVVGIYGMNFDFMPELNQAWGYPAVMGFMLAVVVGMLAYFKRRGWF